MVGLVRLLFPLMMRTMFGGLRVHIDPEDLEKLRRYKGQRMLLLPNHPTGEEPAVMFVISMQLGEIFNFVAARELFDLERGFRGWVMRRLGVYSVIRGVTDRESFMTSKKILMTGKNRLIIFIEGEISRQNDTLIPFEPGVIQLTLWAQEALAKEAGKANRKQTPASPDERTADHGAGPDYPPVYIAPVAIKYYYLPGVDVAIEQSIRALEKSVGIQSKPEAERYARVRAIAKQVVQVQEALHQIVSLPGTTMNDRVGAIKHRMLKKIEVFLGLKPDPEASTLERLREIRNMMDRMIHTYEDPQDLSDYEKRTIEHFRLAMSEFYRDLDRVTYFLTYDEAYLRDHQSPEHFIEMLHRLEKEVFGVGRLVYPRVAVVKVGEVIDLKARFDDYEADKKGLVKQVAAGLETNMMTLLASAERPPNIH
jgi:1-acyl-sn-glycerol-3-phosphate acyltransferase